MKQLNTFSLIRNVPKRFFLGSSFCVASSKVPVGMLGAVFLVALGLLLAACPDITINNSSGDGGDGNGNGGGGGGGTPYLCENGTPVAQRDATADNINKCQSCNDGFRLYNEQCVAARYTCEHGTPADGMPEGNVDADKCKACNSGYTLQNTACVRAGEYFCQNGTPQSGPTSSGMAEHECVACRNGYKIVNNQCALTEFTCTNGTAASGNPSTGNEDVENCHSCYTGYTKRANNTCTIAQYTCSNGTPVPGGPSTGTQDEERCESCSSGYLLTANNRCTNDLDGDAVLNSADVDDDNNGLIEVSTLEMLHNMRFDLAGASYKTSAADSANTAGAPTSGNKALYYVCGDDNVGLCGYELTQNLTFDTASNGTFTHSSGTYTLDSADNNATYFPVAVDGSGGWLPIGDNDNPFVAIFDGNGYTITGLAIKRNQTYIGMFGYINTGAHIRNVGLVDNLADYSGSSDSRIYVGGLVGYQENGSITASYATGNADAGVGAIDYTGGLVGYQESGSITASYTTGSADGGDGIYNSTGGLVGYHNGGSITASYATGNANGGGGRFDYTGGLVGYQENGSITASYATGNAYGEGRSSDYTGGLVGRQQSGSITASYATGNAYGGAEVNDSTGGLVGYQSSGSITASYATGNADGGDGNSDFSGGLLGYQEGGYIIASYATGNANGGTGNTDYTGGLVGEQENGSITASYATGSADGGDGDDDRAGGLVGYQKNGSITASYATGSADGGDGDDDYSGGLVGWQEGGSITASYATGSATGGAGGGDYVGQLIGRRITAGSHRASYGFGGKNGENNGIDRSTLPNGITTAAALTATNLTGCVGIAHEKAYTTQTTCQATSKTACAWDDDTATCSGMLTGIKCSVFTAQDACIATTGKTAGTWNGDVWNAAASGTAGAWDFGDGSQAPALKYADYDGSGGNTYNCNQFPSNVTCGTTLLPGQRQ